MLERYGIVTRETVLAEGVPGGFSSLYGELSNLEMLGTARRGYFVEGLGGAQFALAGAVERLRSLPRVDEELAILAATDPAQPYGAAIAWPRPPGAGDGEEGGRGGRRPSRVAGAFVLLRNGEPALYVERGGKGLLRLARLDPDALATALAALVAAVRERRLPRLAIERIDGEPALGHELEEALIDAGFERQPRRLVAAP
jgi:ATP-dependent Lhr-like helicase